MHTSPLCVPNHAALAYMTAQRCAASPRAVFCVVLDDNHQAHRFIQALNSFLANAAPTVLFLPDWETLAYDHVHAHTAVTTQRLRTLYHLSVTDAPYILITTVRACTTRLVPFDFISRHSFIIRCGDSINPQTFRNTLLKKGYIESNSVREVAGSGLDTDQ